jgi:hypothetical protein
MSDLEQEMNEALDALEEEHDIDPIEPKESEDNLEDEPEVKSNPPGYIDNLDDWVAAGKDPDDFKGKNAYSAEYERIKEIKELKAMTSKLVDGVGEWKKDQEVRTRREVEQARADLKTELDSAREDADVDRALAAQTKIDDLNKPPEAALKPNQAITDFYAKNPIIDKSSDQFDQDFYEDCAMMQHTIMNQLTGGNEELAKNLTEAQIKRSMNVAYEQAKALHSDKFVSKRNSRKQVPSQGKRPTPKATAGDYGARLKGLGASSRNARDTTPALDTYNMLLGMDKGAAEKFAKNMLGE